MSIWGDQWNCKCGWANLFVRRYCRNCGCTKPNDTPVTPAIKVMNDVWSGTKR